MTDLSAVSIFLPDGPIRVRLSVIFQPEGPRYVLAKPRGAASRSLAKVSFQRLKPAKERNHGNDLDDSSLAEVRSESVEMIPCGRIRH